MAGKSKAPEHDPEVEQLDELIRSNVMRHIWEARNGLRFRTDGIVLFCSCGVPVMVLRAEDVSNVLLPGAMLDMRLAREAHGRHAANRLGEALSAWSKLITKEKQL